MKQYEYLEHTADVKFRAYGKTLEETFINCAYASADVISDHKNIKPKISHKIKIESEDEKALLYDFLEQIIILIDTDRFLLSEVKDLKIEKKEKLKLTATFVGDVISDNYEIEKAVKAMTYQEMVIEKTKTGFMIQVVLDI